MYSEKNEYQMSLCFACASEKFLVYFLTPEATKRGLVNPSFLSKGELKILLGMQTSFSSLNASPPKLKPLSIKGKGLR